MKKLCLSLALIICVGVFAYTLLPTANAAEAGIRESGNYLYGTPERTTLSAFKRAYTRPGYSVFDKDSNALPEDSLIGTGCKLCYEAGDVGETKELTIIVTGDIDGNGKVTTTDYIAIKNQLVCANLDDTKKLAADVDGYGISTSDYIKVKLHFEGAYDLYGGIIIPDESTDSSTTESEAVDEPWTSGWA